MDQRIDDALDIRSLPSIREFAHILSRFGEGWIVLAIGSAVAVLARLRGRLRLAHVLIVVALAALLSGLSATVLRTLVGRTRPQAHAPQGVYGLRYNGRWISGKYEFGSFPSGHAATVVALAAALWLFNRRAGLAAIPYAGLVCWSRIGQSCHHFSDVVAGAILGAFLAVFFVRRLDPIVERTSLVLERQFGPRPVLSSDSEQTQPARFVGYSARNIKD